MIIWFQQRKKGATLLDGVRTAPRPRSALLALVIAFALAGVVGYSLPRGDVTFKAGERTLPFTTEGFLMSFSLPNFFFHAATAYDILRHNGAPLGKRDFIGRLNLKG